METVVVTEVGLLILRSAADQSVAVVLTVALKAIVVIAVAVDVIYGIP